MRTNNATKYNTKKYGTNISRKLSDVMGTISKEQAEQMQRYLEVAI